MPKVKDKERILKAAREKQGPKTHITLSSKPIIQNGRTDEVLPRQGKARGVHHHQAIII